MTLVCAECGDSLGRSDTLPGREAVLVHPVMMGLAYVPVMDSDERKYEPVYMQSYASVALCLECIEEKLPADRKEVLRKVYATYEAEMSYEEQKKEDAGRWFGPGEEPESHKKFRIWDSASKLVPQECIFTGKLVKDREPHFICYVIDRINSDLGSHFFAAHDGNKYGNYQVLGRLERSGTSFPISFDALKKNFPSVFKELSCEMRGVVNTDRGENKSEILITPEFKAIIEKTTGKSIAQLLPDGVGILGNELRQKDKLRNR